MPGRQQHRHGRHVPPSHAAGGPQSSKGRDSFQGTCSFQGTTGLCVRQQVLLTRRVVLFIFMTVSGEAIQHLFSL